MNASVGRPAIQFYEFGPFRLDVTEHVLFRDGAAISLKPKVFDTLLVLVESSGHVIEKNELMKTLWPDTVVEENNLNQYISSLRRALGDGENMAQYIETVPRRGYRFVATVRELRDESADLVLEKHSLSSVVIEEEERDNRALKAGVSRLLPAAGRRWWASRKVVTGSALIAALGVAGYFLISSKSKQPETISTVRSIAVLPFKPLISDSEDEYLGLGMTDALITRLGSLDQVIVRPTSAVRRYTAPDQDSMAIGRELKVESVLDGSIQKAGDRVRLTVQLVSVADGRHLWTDKFDERFTDLLAIEDRVSERVAAALALKLSGKERKVLEKHYTENSEAHQLYLKGRYFSSKLNNEAMKKAAEQFRQATELDPNYALAYVGLADFYIAAQPLFSPQERYAKAGQAVRKALEIDGNLAEAHISLARILEFFEWQWADAEREYKQALELNPNYALGHHWYATHLRIMGRVDEAKVELKRAQELDPLALNINANMVGILIDEHNYDEAIRQLQERLAMESNTPGVHVTLAMAYYRKGMGDQAVDEWITADALVGLKNDRIAALRQAYRASGMRGFFQEWLKQALEPPVYEFGVAQRYAIAGEKDLAFEWLEKVYEERHPALSSVNIMPAFEDLRSDARFKDLLRRMGLPQ